MTKEAAGTAPADDASAALVVIETGTALDVFKDTGKVQALVDRVRQLATAEQHDGTTPEGRAALKLLARKVSRSKTYIDDAGKALVDDLKALPRLIDASRKMARDQLDALRDEILKPVTAFEAEQERIKAEAAARERAEQERQDALRRRIDGFRQAPLAAIGKRASEIEQQVEALNDDRPGEEFGGQLQDAMQAWQDAVAKLQYMVEQAEAVEAQEREARDRQVAEDAARREREAAEQRVRQAQLDAERAERERLAAEQRVRDAEAAAERERAASAEREQQAAARAAEQERQRVAAEWEAARQAEAKRAADVEHRKAINNQAVSDLMAHAGLPLPQAREVVKAIYAGKISSITITY